MLCAQYCLADTHSTAFTTSSSKASAATALTPHILSAAYKAQLALPILSSRSVVSGFLTSAAELVVHAVQLLAAPLAAAAASSNSQQQQRMPLQQVAVQGRQGQAGKQQLLLRGKGAGKNSGSKGAQQAKKGKQGRQGTAPQDRLFTRRAQPQHTSSQQQQQEVLSQGASPPASDAEVDDMLYIFEAVLLYLLPAAVRGWDALGLAAAAAGGAVGAVGAGMGVWAHAGDLQEEQHAAAAMLQGVLRVLTAVMDAGRVQGMGWRCPCRTFTFSCLHDLGLFELGHGES